MQTIRDELRNRFEGLKLKQEVQVNDGQKETEITIEELEEEKTS